MLALVRANEVARQHRHDREREDEGPAEREEHRRRHRPEELALDPDQREHRQVDDGDDRLAEHRRPADLERGRAHHVDALLGSERAALGALGLGEAAHGVLDDDHRAVDDEPEVDRAEAREVPGDARRVHHRHGEEHRQRDGDGDDEAGAEIAEQDQQHQDHQHGALEQVLADGEDGAVDELAAIVERLDPRALRQRRPERGELALHGLGDGARVLAHQHQRHADHRLALAVLRRRAEAHARAEADLGDHGDREREAVGVAPMTTRPRSSRLLIRPSVPMTKYSRSCSM